MDEKIKNIIDDYIMKLCNHLSENTGIPAIELFLVYKWNGFNKNVNIILDDKINKYWIEYQGEIIGSINKEWEVEIHFNSL